MSTLSSAARMSSCSSASWWTVRPLKAATRSSGPLLIRHCRTVARLDMPGRAMQCNAKRGQIQAEAESSAVRKKQCKQTRLNFRTTVPKPVQKATQAAGSCRRWRPRRSRSTCQAKQSNKRKRSKAGDPRGERLKRGGEAKLSASRKRATPCRQQAERPAPA